MPIVAMREKYYAIYEHTKFTIQSVQGLISIQDDCFFGMKLTMIFGIMSIENLCKDIFFDCPPYTASTYTASYLIDVRTQLHIDIP